MFTANIKPDSYLKIKSGIFSTKVQVDEIMEDLEEEQELSEQDIEAIKKEVDKDTTSRLVPSQHYIFNELLGEVFHQENSKLDVIDKKGSMNLL